MVPRIGHHAHHFHQRLLNLFIGVGLIDLADEITLQLKQLIAINGRRIRLLHDKKEHTLRNVHQLMMMDVKVRILLNNVTHDLESFVHLAAQQLLSFSIFEADNKYPGRSGFAPYRPYPCPHSHSGITGHP